ncbi:unnamed protein product [Heligmosomoides polygyrus]|uniref:Uncharacterized protein n=1 Tax=Heligmosomoides polygyrus TaxID=6339 RepID=A0A183G4C1_HELPZ|nr:unnamed protein product [Heligmosomoides polygyrus]
MRSEYSAGEQLLLFEIRHTIEFLQTVLLDDVVAELDEYRATVGHQKHDVEQCVEHEQLVRLLAVGKEDVVVFVSTSPPKPLREIQAAALLRRRRSIVVRKRRKEVTATAAG